MREALKTLGQLAWGIQAWGAQDSDAQAWGIQAWGAQDSDAQAWGTQDCGVQDGGMQCSCSKRGLALIRKGDGRNQLL